MANLAVKIIEEYAADITGASSVYISIMLDCTTNIKYFEVFVALDFGAFEKVCYAYPDVNPMVYTIIDAIEREGGCVITDNRLMGPSLRYKDIGQGEGPYCYMGPSAKGNDINIALDAIAPMTTPVPLTDFFNELLEV
jgi:hypothetical protein